MSVSFRPFPFYTFAPPVFGGAFCFRKRYCLLDEYFAIIYLQFNLFLEPYEEYGVAGIPHSLTPKTAELGTRERRRNPNSCAECLLLMQQATAVIIGLRQTGSNIAAVFMVFINS